MADNTYVNKVIYGGNTLIDLTSDTAEANKVLSGYTFHTKSGAAATGSCSYDADTSDATASASEILAGQTAYVNGVKVTGSMPNRTGASGSITTKAQEYTIPNGYHDGSGKVSIASVEQAKLIPGNILEGVTILGVLGTLSPSSSIHIEANKNATPTVSSQVVLPSSGFDAVAQVTIAAIPYSETDNAAGGKTVSIASSV